MSFTVNTNTKVKLANGQLINIEDLKFSDWVMDKNNFPTNLRGVLKFSYAPYDNVININNELLCGWDQIFLGWDGYYYVYNGLNNESYTKRNYSTILRFLAAKDTIATRIFVGIEPTMIRNLEVGTVLRTENGPKTVNSIEVVNDFFQVYPPEKDILVDHYFKDVSQIDVNSLNIYDFFETSTILVSHVVARSATYIVNGYVCVSVPNNDWDYENDQWIDPNTYEIIFEDGLYQRIPLQQL